jgi:hypothetical protein
MRRALFWIVFASALVTAAVLFACGAGDFDPQSKIDTVRILGVRAPARPSHSKC